MGQVQIKSEANTYVTKCLALEHKVHKNTH